MYLADRLCINYVCKKFIHFIISQIMKYIQLPKQSKPMVCLWSRKNDFVFLNVVRTIDQNNRISLPLPPLSPA